MSMNVNIAIESFGIEITKFIHTRSHTHMDTHTLCVSLSFTHIHTYLERVMHTFEHVKLRGREISSL